LPVEPGFAQTQQADLSSCKRQLRESETLSQGDRERLVLAHEEIEGLKAACAPSKTTSIPSRLPVVEKTVKDQLNRIDGLIDGLADDRLK
jgi:hypothetical protein